MGSFHRPETFPREFDSDPPAGRATLPSQAGSMVLRANTTNRLCQVGPRPLVYPPAGPYHRSNKAKGGQDDADYPSANWRISMALSRVWRDHPAIQPGGRLPGRAGRAMPGMPGQGDVPAEARAHWLLPGLLGPGRCLATERFLDGGCSPVWGLHGGTWRLAASKAQHKA